MLPHLSSFKNNKKPWKLIRFFFWIYPLRDKRTENPFIIGQNFLCGRLEIKYIRFSWWNIIDLKPNPWCHIWLVCFEFYVLRCFVTWYRWDGCLWSFRLNSAIQCVPYHLQLTRENAIQLIQQYPLSFTSWVHESFPQANCWFLDCCVLMFDIVADCSDNVPTRYLVNDACVLTGKPLVSASALRMEGQVYDF